MARTTDFSKIFSATYSNVPVYEFTCENNHVMRRRSDDWINATHILKVAEYDKPARTRILEREVQKGVHEKVQGGYGKYQGTWIPLVDGKDLALKNNVYEKLQPIFDFIPGDRSPPPAPKHATAATRGRVTKIHASTSRRSAGYSHPQDYDAMDISVQDEATPVNGSPMSESAYGEFDTQFSNSRKRRRVEPEMSQADRDHHLWAEDVLDYFMLQEDPRDAQPAPIPPANINLDRPIDEKGHTALHWAAAMGDLELVKDLIRRGARMEAQSRTGETPLMRAVIFTNCFDKQNMDKIASILIRTVNMQKLLDGSSVFHHIANSTQRKSKYSCARYYMDSLLNKMQEVLSQQDIERILNQQDQNGDTAITIAARHGARKCVRSLIGRHAAVDIPNNLGETADQLIVQLNHRRQDRINNRQLSSSPFQPDSHHTLLGGAVQPPNGYHGDHPMNGTSGLTNGITHDVYQSEAALTLTSHIVPVLFSKSKGIAAHLDAEVNEKKAEMAEAERVVAMRRAEIELLKKQAEDLRAKEMEQTGGGAQTDEQLIEQLEELEKEAMGLETELQASEYQRLVEQETAKEDDYPEDELMNDAMEQEGLIRSKLNLVRQLLPLKQKQKDLVDQIVQNMSLAGLGDKQVSYKRLITGALNIKEEDVEGMLPEIVSELEEWRGLESVGA